MDKDEALRKALEALTPFSTPNWAGTGVDKANEAITAINQALAAPVQGPVAQSLKDAVFTVLEGFTLPHDVRKILEAAYYTTPPAAPVPMTIEQRKELIKQECRYTSEAATDDHHCLIQAAEKFHGITAHGINEQPMKTFIEYAKFLLSVMAVMFFAGSLLAIFIEVIVRIAPYLH
jgi:hypothetical protein